MTSKQRAKLRARANSIDTIINIGKEGLTESLICQLSAALNAREIIKGKVLDSAMITPEEVGNYISDKLKSEVVCCIGNKFIIYKKKRNSEKSKNKIAKNKNSNYRKKFSKISSKKVRVLSKNKSFSNNKFKLVKERSKSV